MAALATAALTTGCASAEAPTPVSPAAADPASSGARRSSAPPAARDQHSPSPLSSALWAFYSLAPAEQRVAHRAGLTVLGPAYGDAPSAEVRRDLARRGSGRVHAITPLAVADLGATPESRATQRERALADGLGDPTVVGWYLGPEEARPWRPNELDHLRQGVAQIHAADPLRRPIWHYQPNHRTAAELAPLAIAGLRVCHGAYATHAGYGTTRAFVGWATQQSPHPHGSRCAVLEMFVDAPPQLDAPPAAIVRHDLYAALLAGACDLLVFSGARRPGFTQYDAFFAAYLAEFARLRANPALVAALATPGVPLSAAIEHGPESIPFTPALPDGTTSAPAAVVTAHATGTERHVIALNSAAEPVQLQLLVSLCPVGAPRPVEPPRGPGLRGDRLALAPLDVGVWTCELTEASR